MDILKTIGLRWRDLFPAETARPARIARASMTAARRRPALSLYALSDWLRLRVDSITQVRQFATQLGETEQTWIALARAASAEREAFTIEAALDDLLAARRRA